MGERLTSDCIVVGFDGSAASRAAVEYALSRVAPTGKIIVVHAFGPPPDWMGDPGYQRVLDEHELRGKQLLDALRVELAARATPEVEFELISDPAADAIARVAEVRDADEIVVGSRGFGAVRAALGSVSHGLLHRADRPVVVIPEQAVER
jgi:nucleotide-binding universal stress UspA family protein